jgi:hypothetical protein
MKTRVTRAALTLATLLPTFGCLEAGDDEPELATDESEVIVGDVFPAANSGYVRLGTSQGGCSGTMMTNSFVLTAKHCFGPTDLAVPTNVSVMMSPQSTTAAAIMLHPSADVALMRLTSPLAMNGSTTGFQGLLYPLATNTLAPGTVLTCRGYGINDWNAETGFGTLRTADLPVRGVNFTWWFEWYDLAVNKNARGQFLAPGDSGGSCFKHMANGEKVLAGVTSTVYNHWDATFNGLVGVDTFRAWYAGIVTPSTTVIQQWGQAGDVPITGDFDGDGLSDFTVWRPGDGYWHVRNSVTGAVRSQQWGMNGDIPVTGDFDKDGRPDFTIWRPSDGYWHSLSSVTGLVRSQQWGVWGDIPVPGDYDKDGQTDFAVWRPSNGVWFVINSSTGAIRTQQWGQAGDKPVAGDHSGDGYTDFAVYRPGTGTWFVFNSVTGAMTGQAWGEAGDIPSTAHLGCHATNNSGLAIYRQWSGMFWVHGLPVTAVGAQGDIPVTANYRGLSSPDLAVWRPSNGTWYVQTTTTPCP